MIGEGKPPSDDNKKGDGEPAMPESWKREKERLLAEKEQKVSAKKREDIEYVISLFKAHLIALLPHVVEGLKIKSENSDKIFSAEDETEFAKEYRYLLESIDEWQNKFIKLSQEIINEKVLEDLLEKLAGYLHEMQLKSKKEVEGMSERDIIKNVEEFTEKLTKASL